MPGTPLKAPGRWVVVYRPIPLLGLTQNLHIINKNTNIQQTHVQTSESIAPLVGAVADSNDLGGGLPLYIASVVIAIHLHVQPIHIAAVVEAKSLSEPSDFAQSARYLYVPL